MSLVNKPIKEGSITKMPDSFWKEWDATSLRLLNSGYDLSKIEIVEKK